MSRRALQRPAPTPDRSQSAVVTDAPTSPRRHRLAGHTQLTPDLLDRDPQGGHVLIIAADGWREWPPRPVRPRVGARGQRLRRPADLQLIAPIADGSLHRRGGCCAVARGKAGAVAVVRAASAQSRDDQAGETDRKDQDCRCSTSYTDLQLTTQRFQSASWHVDGDRNIPSHFNQNVSCHMVIMNHPKAVMKQGQASAIDGCCRCRSWTPWLQQPSRCVRRAPCSPCRRPCGASTGPAALSAAA